MNKIGPHIMYSTRAMIAEGSRSPTVVKLFEPSVETCAETRSIIAPDTWILVRFDLGDHQPLDQPRENANWWYENYSKRMHAMRQAGGPLIAFSAYNEVPDSSAIAYADFELARLERMHADGFHVVVGDFSVGCPDFSTWSHYVPVLRAMLPGDWVGLHEYWADREDLHNPYHVGRWRLVRELEGIPIAITECGRDYLSDLAAQGKYPGRAGWRHTTDWAGFMEDLRIYHDLYLRDDPRILGATPFSIGELRDRRRWEAYWMEQEWSHIVSHYTERVPTPPLPRQAVWPIMNPRITQDFGARPSYYARYGLQGHNGLDLLPSQTGPREAHGTRVYAPEAGVLYRGLDPDGYGLYAYIKGEQGSWLLAHLSYLHAADRQRVRAGELIGEMGYTGNCDPPGILGTHLHLGWRPNPIDRSNGYGGYQDPRTRLI